YYSLRTITNIVAIIILMFVLLFTNYSYKLSLIIFLVGVVKLLESQSDIMFGYMQRNENMDKISISMMIKGIGSLILTFIIYYYLQSLVYVVISMIIVRLLTIIFYDKPNIKKMGVGEIKLHWNKVLFKLFLLTFPLGLSTVLGSLKTNVPRYFIESFSGQYELGIFASISYLLVAFGTIVNSLGQAVTPR